MTAVAPAPGRASSARLARLAGRLVAGAAVDHRWPGAMLVIADDRPWWRQSFTTDAGTLHAATTGPRPTARPVGAAGLRATRCSSRPDGGDDRDGDRRARCPGCVSRLDAAEPLAPPRHPQRRHQLLRHRPRLRLRGDARRLRHGDARRSSASRPRRAPRRPRASYWGLVLAYEYSNVPLFVLLSLPAMSAAARRVVGSRAGVGGDADPVLAATSAGRSCGRSCWPTGC